MKILVSNVGSTSLKFRLLEMPEERELCRAKIERVGSVSAIYRFENPRTGYFSVRRDLDVPTYASGIRLFLDDLTDGEHGAAADIGEIGGVGFKTVLARGYPGVHALTDSVVQAMRDCLFIAPAHNGPYLEAIGRFREILPGVPLVGVFETAFHTTIPLERRLYAVPYAWYERWGVARMGYHGASFSYIAEQASADGNFPRVIGCHLGGSSSVCAIQNGRSVDTSFGFSLQTGLPHANRCGDTDAYLVPFLMSEGLTEREILEGMSKNGGLIGISGVSNDLREIKAAADAGNSRAALAIEVFANAVVKYIGAFYAELGGLDKLVFSGGIGENSADVRARICRALGHIGIALDEAANDSLSGGGYISAAASSVKVQVIPADEELGVARQTYRYITGTPNKPEKGN